ncbi:MAG: NYN domain-containing protein [Sulfurospirillum sp.]
MIEEDLRKNLKLAVLIDSDNAQASIISNLLKEIAKYGTANIKRAYGDWTTDRLRLWKEHLHKYAIQPIQQFSYTSGKNSTDSSLIIDAMDILHDNNVDGFCIISSDSDFTRLSTRIRENGLVVYGFGEKKTPEAFISACDEFIFTENLRETTKPTNRVSDDKKLKQMIINAIKAVSNESGLARLTTLTLHIKKTNPEFDTRTYGYEKMGQLVKSLKYLTIEEESFKDGSNNKHILVKIK